MHGCKYAFWHILKRAFVAWVLSMLPCMVFEHAFSMGFQHGLQHGFQGEVGISVIHTSVAINAEVCPTFAMQVCPKGYCGMCKS